MDLNLEIAADQIDGDRPYQEDSFLTAALEGKSGKPNTSALLVMADGMGGHAAGNVASQMVVNTFNRQFTTRFGTDDVPKILRKALDKSNDAIRATVDETPALEGMGCTMVTAAIDDGKLYWISVGDSHLYLLRSGELAKKNADHSYGAYLDRMASEGTPVTADPNLKRNMLRSAMTGTEIAEIDNPAKPFILLPGDRLIICSDGLDTLDNEVIRKIAVDSREPKDCVDALLKAVTDAAKPRQDNTTVIVCDAESRDVTGPFVEDKYVDVKPSRGPMIARAALVSLLLAGAAAAWLLVDWAALLEGTKTRLDRPEVPEMAEDDARPDDVVAPGMDAADADDARADVTEDDADDAEAPEEAMPAVTIPETATTFQDRLRGGGEGPLMVSLPGGSFMMGARTGADPSVRPHHRASVPPFAISVYEVTFAEYERFARATGRSIPDNQGLDKSRFPVFGVSWDDALAYVAWLTQQTGHRYRLPSETQWEYAAAAGTDSPYWWGYQLGQDRAHCFNCTQTLNPRQPTTVGGFDPNPFGLYDTVGNVAEWVHDCYHPNYSGAPADGSVWEGGDCSNRVIRGGHYESASPTARRRDTRDPTRGYADVGIRIVRELD